MKIGILTAGGDCPGLNAAIRGVGKAAILQHNMEVVGIVSGFKGLITKEIIQLNEESLSGILTQGGTILGTSREKPFKKDDKNNAEIDKVKLIKENYKQLGLDCLVCIGGNGTQKTAYKLVEEGINVIGIPKTIDNDVWGTDFTFGFDSAVNIATEGIDRLHTTANSHNRIMVIEVMGHQAGWLALYSGVAGGGDIILLPEIPYDESIIAGNILERASKRKNYSIVVVAEGIETPKKKNSGHYIAKRIQELTGIETRETVLGYIQRGGTPSPMDRFLATRFGIYAADMIANKQFGQMVTLNDNKINRIALKEVAGKLNTINARGHMINQFKQLGICFGDEPVKIRELI